MQLMLNAKPTKDCSNVCSKTAAEIRAACEDKGVPFFFKLAGDPPPFRSFPFLPSVGEEWADGRRDEPILAGALGKMLGELDPEPVDARKTLPEPGQGPGPATPSVDFAEPLNAGVFKGGRDPSDLADAAYRLLVLSFLSDFACLLAFGLHGSLVPEPASHAVLLRARTCHLSGRPKRARQLHRMPCQAPSLNPVSRNTCFSISII